MEPNIDTHLLFVTLHDGYPVLNWRDRETGEPTFVHDYSDELFLQRFTPEEILGLAKSIRNSRIDRDIKKVVEKARLWDFNHEARKARDLRTAKVDEIAEIIRQNRHRSDVSIARIIVEIDYDPEAEGEIIPIDSGKK
jgi:hypothetical protein